MVLPDWQGTKILILGDVILDRFVRGRVNRISPEAPIPVVEVTGESALPGGAANVAANITSLGGAPILLGVVGADGGGKALRKALSERSIDDSEIIEVEGRETTVKTRIVAHQQQVVRVDREKRDELEEATRRLIESRLASLVKEARAIVVSDYAKGVLSPGLLRTVGTLATEYGIPYIVDPKPVHFPYPGASLVTPNRQEAAGFIGRPLNIQRLQVDAAALLERTDWKAVLFTLGADGMALAERGKPVERIRSRVREVFDVTGAGDSVVATATLALAANMGLRRAAMMANAAAGVVVGKAGTAVCTPEELAEAISELQYE